MSEDRAEYDREVRHEVQMEDGTDLYVCDTCGSMFQVSQVHEEPTRCPWGEYHD